MSTELSPTHFLTCGGYSAFICAPEATANQLENAARELRKMVDAAINAHGGKVSIPDCLVCDLANSRRPDLHYGCYVVEKDMAPGRFHGTIIPTEGTAAYAVAACERYFNKHFTGCRLETHLTSVWWSEPLQRFCEDNVMVTNPASGEVEAERMSVCEMATGAGVFNKPKSR